ncbi:hypothetical protein LTR05_005495 [Lithohypha guttulata]|uniref:Ribosomal protein S15 n=1 Tax=Lithohypha guttulata TaxID=1690604 RepID=A0AAN7YA23_9EURO|nr:hypothetical protein LTR05_005495 [Lithohypha guttulata]
MPPRIPTVSANGYRSFNLTSLLQALPRQSDTLTPCSMKRGGKRKPNQRLDPYRVEQARQRKAANIEKRYKLQAERAAALGDPVRSKPTPFLTSLNLVQATQPGQAAGSPTGDTYLNYQLNSREAEEQIAHSKWLTEPLESQVNDKQAYEKRAAQHEAHHQNATAAIERITNLGNSSSGDRTRLNIQRCIDTFGRHTTDTLLPPKPSSLGPTKSSSTMSELLDEPLSVEEAERQRLLSELASIPKRSGPDTGSSEVQIAILTTKINVLAQNLQGADKHNKRELRLLVHKRQKLLKYLRKKERGGPRWQNIVDNLGINDAMWKGEITLA